MKELIVDNFAGGGGASKGIEMALGRSPDIAINHDAAAIAMHKANHPGTEHYTEDVWKVSPWQVTKGAPVGLLWLSPDCKHFSRAKGSKPVEKKIRSLAWVAHRWVAEAKPRVVILENVREFEDWGPLVPRWKCSECDWRGTEGQARLVRTRRACPRCDARSLEVTADMVPCPERKGMTFKRFVGRFRSQGYKVDWKVLNAADYGAPTHRRRLFLIARRDGNHIVWPEATHGDPKKRKNDLFGILKPYRTAAECIDWSLPCPSIFDRKKPLADATMKRIALGIKRYVLDAKEPFIVLCNHSGEGFRGQDLKEPLCTVAASRDAIGLVTPYVARIGHKSSNGKNVNGTDEPLTTITSKNEHLLVAPILSKYHGQRGTDPQSRCYTPSDPFMTLDTQNRFGLVTAFLAKHFTGAVASEIKEPIGTITSKDHNALVAANLVHLNNGKSWSDCNDPMRTVVSGGQHAALVYSFLVKYFGNGFNAVPVTEPMPTVTSKDRFGLVTVQVNGETYVIVDIGMRMLVPRELARAQGFPEDYILTGTKTSQTARIGNSVSPVMSEALVRANFSDFVMEAAA